MPAPPVTVSRSGPSLSRIRADVERLRKSDVLVGVPSNAEPRVQSLQSKIDALQNRPLKPGLKNPAAAMKRRQRNVETLQARLGAQSITNAELMWIHSKGSPLKGIPARPTIEPGILQARRLITPELAKASQALIENKPDDAEKYLHRAGTLAANSAKRIFGSSQLAPNAPSTIARKGSDAPLIDFSFLRRSIVSVIRVVGKEPVTTPEAEPTD